MSFWKIFANLGTIISSLKAVESVVAGCIRDKRPPSSADGKVLIDSVEKLINTGLIDIPGVDEKTIVDGLESIKNQLP